ncbi:hypothetical protein ACJX0J_030607, partial [Zea mays]
NFLDIYNMDISCAAQYRETRGRLTNMNAHIFMIGFTIFNHETIDLYIIGWGLSNDFLFLIFSGIGCLPDPFINTTLILIYQWNIIAYLFSLSNVKFLLFVHINDLLMGRFKYGIIGKSDMLPISCYTHHGIMYNH